MSKNKKYKILEIKNGYGDQAYWRSVVLPGVPKKYHKQPKQCVDVLQKRWRILLAKLNDAEYPSVEKAFVFCCNCPPVSVQTDVWSRRCNLQRICPFCWGREYTFKVWNKLFPVLFPAKNQLSAGGNVLCYWHKSEFKSLEAAVTNFSIRRGEIALLRARGVEVRGGFNFAYLRPSANDETYYIWSGGIALTGQYTDELSGFARWQYKPHIQRAELPNLFAKAMPYPADMFKTEPGRLIAALDATQGMRALRLYGSLR